MLLRKRAARRCCRSIGETHDVDALCKAFPGRIEMLIKTEQEMVKTEFRGCCA